MKFPGVICWLACLAAVCQAKSLRDGGRNEGEPDYDPGVSFNVRDGGRNDGEPDYDPIFLQTRSEYNPRYLMLYPEDFQGSSNLNVRSSVPNDVLNVPDSVWEKEKNNSNSLNLRQTGTPPAQACLKVKVIYNQAWVNSAGGGNLATAHKMAQDVITKANEIYNTKFAAANRLGTAITLSLVANPTYDNKGTWQATSNDIQNIASHTSQQTQTSHIDTSSYSTQHYAFLSGQDNGGALGIAYLGTTCLRLGGDQKYKVSINEWHNNLDDTASVVAHEMGHGLGMSHDFGSGGTSDVRKDSQGNSCTGINGLMDYGARSSVDKFTTCSKEDFTAFYNRVVQTYGSFCLTCDSTNPATSTAASTTKTAGGTCNPNFVDKDGDGCQKYAARKWCSSTGGFGSGWSTTWGTFESYAVNGQTAAVCPQCGCGTAATTPAPKTTPPAKQCGIKPASIVGGSAVTPYSLPWQVGLVGLGSDRPGCGGTLISDRHVLTAAHCMGGNFEVMVGEHHVTSTDDGTRHKVCSVVSHPKYNGGVSQSYDFAIVTLKEPVQLGARAVPACLPESAEFGGSFLDDKTMTVSGWGALGSGGGSPTELHSVDVPGISNEQCANMYHHSKWTNARAPRPTPFNIRKYKITEDMMCAGHANGGIDSCQGDSGGPFTYTGGVPSRTYVVGVVSWGFGCADGNFPGVYGRVTHVLDWVKEQMTNTC